MLRKLSFVIAVVCILQIVVSTIVIFLVATSDIEDTLKKRAARINENIGYNGSLWDISRYNSDPELIGNYPLYVILNDGFVLDRRYEISGFLDSSDFEKLLTYRDAQTRESVSGQIRRVYSFPINDGSEEIVGVVTVSHLDPDLDDLEKVDGLLAQVAGGIARRLDVSEGRILTNRLDERDIPYSVTFLIVDKYNKILAKTSNVNNIRRTPHYIDPSYVVDQMDNLGMKFIRDGKTGEYFLTYASPLQIGSATQGLIVTGVGLSEVFTFIGRFLALFVPFSVLSMFFLWFVLIKKNRGLPRTLNSGPNSIWFDDKNSRVHIDGNSIKVTYATNQYYLLKALFSNPKKRWETDELLERFGEFKGKTDGRKVYDTMANINKKMEGYLRQKFIINENKTYQLNPDLPIAKSGK